MESNVHAPTRSSELPQPAPTATGAVGRLMDATSDAVADLPPGTAHQADVRPRRDRYSDEELFAALRSVANRLPPGPIIRDQFGPHQHLFQHPDTPLRRLA